MSKDDGGGGKKKKGGAPSLAPAASRKKYAPKDPALRAARAKRRATRFAKRRAEMPLTWREAASAPRQVERHSFNCAEARRYLRRAPRRAEAEVRYEEALNEARKEAAQ